MLAARLDQKLARSAATWTYIAEFALPPDREACKLIAFL